MVTLCLRNYCGHFSTPTVKPSIEALVMDVIGTKPYNSKGLSPGLIRCLLPRSLFAGRPLISALALHFWILLLKWYKNMLCTFFPNFFTFTCSYDGTLVCWCTSLPFTVESNGTIRYLYLNKTAT